MGDQILVQVQILSSLVALSGFCYLRRIRLSLLQNQYKVHETRRKTGFDVENIPIGEVWRERILKDRCVDWTPTVDRDFYMNRSKLALD